MNLQSNFLSLLSVSGNLQQAFVKPKDNTNDKAPETKPVQPTVQNVSPSKMAIQLTQGLQKEAQDTRTFQKAEVGRRNKYGFNSQTFNLTSQLSDMLGGM